MSDTPDDNYGEWTSFGGELSQSALSIADVWKKDATPVPEQRYQKVSILGQGGMGRVWLGWDAQLERSVAIKEPLNGHSEAERLMREAKLCARLDHSGVVAVYDVYTEDEQPNFVMALVRGQTFASVLNHAETEENKAYLRHILEVCEAVGHAHRLGIVHRDLTPRNIVIDQDGAARVIDWGLAIRAGETHVGRSGTPGFASPEQESGGTVDPAADVWSLGALLHWVLCGKPPGGAQIPANVDPELRAIVERALQGDAADRYANAIEMGADVRRWFEGRRVEAFHFTPWSLLLRFVRVYRARIGVGITVLSALFAVTAYGVWSTANESERARLAEVEATKRSSELLRRDAEIASRHGDLWRARTSAQEALRLDSSVEAKGLWMLLSMIEPPELMSRIELPECRAWVLGQKNDVQICHVGEHLIQGWKGKDRVWESKVYAVNVRVSDDEVHVLDNHRALTVLDRNTGEIRSADPRSGEFSTPLVGVNRLDLARRSSLDDSAALSPCEFGIAAIYPTRELRWSLCTDGKVFTQNDEATSLVSLKSGEPPVALAIAGGRAWGATQQGRINDVDGRFPSLDLGESLLSIEAIPESPQILAVGGGHAVRVFDSDRGTWVAGFPDDVQTAFPGHKSVWLIRNNALEQWRVPQQPIWNYQSVHGFSTLRWSSDGSKLAAVDGGGYYHLLEPENGRAMPPFPFGIRVGKDVAFDTSDGDFRALNMDETGIWRMHLTDGKITATQEIPHSGSASGIGVLKSGRKFFVSYNSGIIFYAADDTQTVVLPDKLIRMVDVSQDAQQVLLMGDDGVWLMVDGQEPAKVATEGARLGALSPGGMISLVRKDVVQVVDATGHVLKSWRGLPSTTSITWAGDSMIVSGHLDGQIGVWTSDGKLLASMKHHEGRVSSLGVSADGRRLAAASWDGSISVSRLDAPEILGH